MILSYILSLFLKVEEADKCSAWKKRQSMQLATSLSTSHASSDVDDVSIFGSYCTHIMLAKC